MGRSCDRSIIVLRPGMPADMELFSRALISIVRVGMRLRGFA